MKPTTALPNDISPAPQYAVHPLVGFSLVFGVAIRLLPALLDSSFWFDEAFTVTTARFGWREIPALTKLDAHPPLYYFVIRAMMDIADDIAGVFESLAWLRMASVVPGLLLIAAAWPVVRRSWGERAAGWVAVFFSVSPVLAYFSVELRSYALLLLIVFLATSILLALMQNQFARPWLGVGAYAACATLALYTHAQAALFLSTHLVLFAGELALAKKRRSAILKQGATAAGVVTLLFAPWLRILVGQMNYFASAYDGIPYLHMWETGRAYPSYPEIASTFFFYLPFGPLGDSTGGWVWSSWRPLLLFTTLAFFAVLLTVLAVQFARSKPIAFQPDRLLVYAAALTLLPLVQAFILTLTGRGWTFMPMRFNLTVAPYALISFVGLARMVRPEGFAKLILGSAAAVLAIASLYLQTHRNDGLSVSSCIPTPSGDFPQLPAQFILTDQKADTWLDRTAGIELIDLNEAIQQGGDPDDWVWFASHRSFSIEVSTWGHEAIIFEHILGSEPEVEKVDYTCWTWPGIWKTQRRTLPQIAQRWDSLKGMLRGERSKMRDGLLVTPYAPAIRFSKGWLPMDGSMSCWTDGEEQEVAWRGPDEPGKYRLRATFWRPHPFPEEEVEFRYQLPGSTEWNFQTASTGQVVVEREIEITRPSPKLRMAFRIPTWIPSENLPGSPDQRELGFIFQAIELEPMFERAQDTE